MNYDEAMNMSTVEFGDMPPQAFLLGLLSAFDNKYQASADSFLKYMAILALPYNIKRNFCFLCTKINTNIYIIIMIMFMVFCCIYTNRKFYMIIINS